MEIIPASVIERISYNPATGIFIWISDHKYNPALNYMLHMPCSIYCKESITFGEKIKDCLEKNDIEAAEWLREFNENSWPKSVNQWTEETWHDHMEKRKKDVNS